MNSLTVQIVTGRYWYEGMVGRKLRVKKVDDFHYWAFVTTGTEALVIHKDDCIVTGIHYEGTEDMDKQFQCDIKRCEEVATWHGFGGRSHFCDKHKPEAESERPYTPGDSGMFKARDGLTFEGRKRQ